MSNIKTMKQSEKELLDNKALMAIGKYNYTGPEQNQFSMARTNAYDYKINKLSERDSEEEDSDSNSKIDIQHAERPGLTSKRASMSLDIGLRQNSSLFKNSIEMKPGSTTTSSINFIGSIAIQPDSDKKIAKLWHSITPSTGINQKNYDFIKLIGTNFRSSFDSTFSTTPKIGGMFPKLNRPLLLKSSSKRGKMDIDDKISKEPHSASLSGLESAMALMKKKNFIKKVYTNLGKIPTYYDSLDQALMNDTMPKKKKASLNNL